MLFRSNDEEEGRNDEESRDEGRKEGRKEESSAYSSKRRRMKKGREG